jgi:hypothetical protein
MEAKAEKIGVKYSKEARRMLRIHEKAWLIPPAATYKRNSSIVFTAKKYADFGCLNINTMLIMTVRMQRAA